MPFGLLIGRFRGVDLREAGSGNIGATNAWRILGKSWGLLCFGLDVCKGLVPVLLSGWWMGVLGRDDLPAGEQWLWLSVVFAAVMGHVFPVWLKFKGGKGVATAFGALLGMWPMLTWPVVTALVVWVITVKISGYVSLASCGAALTLPAAVLVIAISTGTPIAQTGPVLTLSAAMAVLVMIRHRTNIARLLAGNESKISGGDQSH
jgi:glycerol-3-phosphate acyltransferase PlsY